MRLISLPPKDKLEEYYKDNTQIELAKMFNVGRSTIQNRLKKYGVKPIERRGGKNRINFIDRKTLYNLYIIEEYSAIDIGKRYRVDKSLVLARLQEFGIKRRNGHEARNTNHKENKFCGKNNPSYKNGFTRMLSGYCSRYVLPSELESHRADKNHKTYLHVYIFENYLGRKLKSDEVIHHIDLDRGNNDLINLMLFPTSREHLEFENFIKRYGLYKLGIVKDKPEYKFPKGTIIPKSNKRILGITDAYIISPWD